MPDDVLIKDITGVVLAGGDGERFDGGKKSMAKLNGKPLVAHAVEALDGVFRAAPTVVVKNERQRLVIKNALDTEARFVYDDPGFEGPVAGLLGALKSTYLDWLFVCGCDMPYITEDSVLWLLRKSQGGVDAVVPVDSEGYPQTLHSLYRHKSVDRVKEALGPNDSLRDILEVLPEVDRISVPEEVEGATRSIDTEEELAEYTGRERL